MNGTDSCLAGNQPLLTSRDMGLAGALLRLAKPGIVLVEIMAGLAGMLLVPYGPPAAPVVLPTLLAIALAAGGAAMLNGVLDAAADRRMPRLACRCRALERVGHRRLLFIALILMGSGTALAALTVPAPAALLLAAGCVCYVLLYTAWLKRRSPWGVLAGGIPGALPPLIGAAAVSGSLHAAPLLLAALIFIWQLPHFWLLALQHRDQYAQAGIPVLPLSHGEPATKALSLAASVLLVPAGFAVGLAGGLSSAYLVLAVVSGAVFTLFLADCLYRSHHYRRGFIASLVYLLVIVAAVCCQSMPAPLGFNCW